MVGVQDEQDVERPLQPRIRLVLELGHLVEHVQEVAGVAQVVVRIDVRLPHVVAERERRQRRHLRDQPDHVGVADVLVLDLRRVGIERRQRGHRRAQHPHRVRVVAVALHELLDVLVHERVDRDLVRPLVELRLVRQLAVDEQVGDLEIGRLLGELLDRIAAVLQDALVAVDVRDRRATRRRVHERRVVGHQAEVVVVDLDVSQRRRADGPVLDRHLVRATGPVVGDRQRLGSRGYAVTADRLFLGAHGTYCDGSAREDGRCHGGGHEERRRAHHAARGAGRARASGRGRGSRSPTRPRRTRSARGPPRRTASSRSPRRASAAVSRSSSTAGSYRM